MHEAPDAGADAAPGRTSGALAQGQTGAWNILSFSDLAQPGTSAWPTGHSLRMAGGRAGTRKSKRSRSVRQTFTHPDGAGCKESRQGMEDPPPRVTPSVGLRIRSRGQPDHRSGKEHGASCISRRHLAAAGRYGRCTIPLPLARIGGRGAGDEGKRVRPLPVTPLRARRTERVLASGAFSNTRLRGRPS